MRWREGSAGETGKLVLFLDDIRFEIEWRDKVHQSERCRRKSLNLPEGTESVNKAADPVEEGRVDKEGYLMSQWYQLEEVFGSALSILAQTQNQNCSIKTPS